MTLALPAARAAAVGLARTFAPRAAAVGLARTFVPRAAAVGLALALVGCPGTQLVLPIGVFFEGRPREPRQRRRRRASPPPRTRSWRGASTRST